MRQASRFRSFELTDTSTSTKLEAWLLSALFLPQVVECHMKNSIVEGPIDVVKELVLSQKTDTGPVAPPELDSVQLDKEAEAAAPVYISECSIPAVEPPTELIAAPPAVVELIPPPKAKRLFLTQPPVAESQSPPSETVTESYYQPLPPDTLQALREAARLTSYVPDFVYKSPDDFVYKSPDGAAFQPDLAEEVEYEEESLRADTEASREPEPCMASTTCPSPAPQPIAESGFCKRLGRFMQAIVSKSGWRALFKKTRGKVKISNFFRKLRR